jgi:hypothetical protein
MARGKTARTTLRKQFAFLLIDGQSYGSAVPGAGARCPDLVKGWSDAHQALAGLLAVVDAAAAIGNSRAARGRQPVAQAVPFAKPCRRAKATFGGDMKPKMPSVLGHHANCGCNFDADHSGVDFCKFSAVVDLGCVGARLFAPASRPHTRPRRVRCLRPLLIQCRMKRL